MDETRTWSEMSKNQLQQELHRRDWNIGAISVTSQGVILTLREHYTSDFPGMVTRKVFGKNMEDALQRFLEDFEAQRVR